MTVNWNFRTSPFLNMWDGPCVRFKIFFWPHLCARRAFSVLHIWLHPQENLLLQMSCLRFRGNKSLSQVCIGRICQSLFFDSSYELLSAAFLVFYTFHVGFLVCLMLIDYVLSSRDHSSVSVTGICIKTF